MNRPLHYLSIAEAASLIRRRKLSPVELSQHILARIDAFNPRLNAFITVTPERALRQARVAEREIMRGRIRSPLHGIPITLKDNICTEGIRTTAGSKILADFVPRSDAPAARALFEAGAILLGKTNLHEFAYGITSENPHYGPVRNPWNLECIPGGSSGGSAAAVATGLGFASIGTDTGGSIRIPSALCGIVGLKPQFGRVSCDGIIPLAETLDHAGPIARSVEDVAIVLDALCGHSSRGEFRNAANSSKKKPRRSKLRVGRLRDDFLNQIDAEVERLFEDALKVFQSLRAQMTDVRLPHLADSSEPGTQIALAEALAYHESQGYFPARAHDYGEDVRKRLELGSGVRAVDYLKAQAFREVLRADFCSAFERVDVIAAPTVPIPAPRLGQSEVEIGGQKKSIRGLLVGASRPANFTGFPAISVPCGFTRSGLPAGIALHGPVHSEARLLAIALLFESATEWREHHPPEIGS